MAKPVKDLSVLIVDDNAQAVSLISMVLEGIGVARIEAASSGEAALEILGRNGDSFDAVICDRNMPGMSGLELLKAARAARPDLPFLMITGDASPDFVAEAESMGISGLIKKPFTPQLFEEKIAALAENV